MQTRLIYNYKQGDTELGGRIDALALKLNLGENETLQDRIATAVSNAVSAESANREEALENLETRLDTMQVEIDGAISTWFEEGVPDTDTEPAVSWDEDSYTTHLGDLYYDTETGYCYRWVYEDDEYSWILIRDTDVTRALADAAAAQAAADASVKTAQGAANAGHHLVVDAQGRVTADIPSALMLSSQDGLKTYVIAIGEGGSLTVSEVVADDGD